jgi:hypothetical protein
MSGEAVYVVYEVHRKKVLPRVIGVFKDLNAVIMARDERFHEMEAIHIVEYSMIIEGLVQVVGTLFKNL